MLRVTRPGGLAFVSYTVWFGPWGGHETAPWHYLGGRRARRRYLRPARPRAQEQVRRVPVRRDRPRRPGLGPAPARRRGRSTCCPRYHPRWARWLARVPVLRELRHLEPRHRGAQGVSGTGDRSPRDLPAGGRATSRLRMCGYAALITALASPSRRGGWWPTPSSTCSPRPGSSWPPACTCGTRCGVRSAPEPGLRLRLADGAVLLARAPGAPAGVGGPAAVVEPAALPGVLRGRPARAAARGSGPRSPRSLAGFAFVLTPADHHAAGRRLGRDLADGAGPVGAAAAGDRAASAARCAARRGAERAGRGRPAAGSTRSPSPPSCRSA